MVARPSFLLAGVLGLALLLGGCTLTGSGSAAANPEIPASTGSALLRNGDSLTIALQGVPDPSNNSVQIDDKGLISLPYVGPITAAGLNTGELSQRIRDTYIAKKIYMTVDVAVSVTERYVYVGGEVVRPGRIIWTPDLTAGKAIQAAGGFTLYAKETKVGLVRDQKTHDIDVKLAQKNPAQDPKLLPGDALQVPRSPF
jgi:polysaccharide export outer membrane protein